MNAGSQVFRSVSYNLPIPSLIFNTDKEFDDWKKKQAKSDEQNLNSMKTHIKGSECEIKMQDFFRKALEDTCPTVMISNFERSEFCGLFKNFKCHDKGVNQELDQFIVLGEYKKVIILEVKSGQEYKRKYEESLEK